MKTGKKLLLPILAFILCLSFVACGGGEEPCTEHIDEDANLVCDICGTEMEETGEGGTEDLGNGELALIVDGKATFQIVKGANISADANRAIAVLKRGLADLGITVEVLHETVDSVKDCEVLIGEVTERGEEYAIDKYTLGPNGYIVKKIGQKIVVLGGSDAALAEAIEAFSEKIIGYKETTESLSDVTMKDEDSIIKPQTSYRVSYIKINDVDAKGYTIAVDKSSNTHLLLAKSLQELMYQKAGYWLPIVSLADADKSIVIRSTSDAGKTGFRVLVSSDGQLIVECAYENLFEKAFKAFVASCIESKFAPINFKNTKGVVHTEEVSIVHYEDFGAVGDGITNDFFSMKEAHDFANQCGQTVIATPGKTYLITKTAQGKQASSISVKTNTVWTGATIVIDDRDIHKNNGTNEYTTSIFNVLPMENNYSLSKEQIDSINEYQITRDTRKLNVTFDTDVLIRVENNTHRTYIRWGGNANDGQPQRECIYVYPDGTMSESTPFMHDFSTVTSVIVTRANLPELTIEGGTVITRASNVNTTINGEDVMVYFSRNISIQRSNTTIRGVDHQVTDELEFIAGEQTGPAYSGFFGGGFASHITLDSCILSARKYYGIAGTYDFGASFSNEISLVNCTMHKFYLENGNISTTGNAYWGVGGTNYCKNMSYINCELTRYDAHSGVYNGKIIGGKIGIINLIGGGDMLIEDVTIIQQSRVFNLRSDYGATWNGTVKIKNVTLDNQSSNVSICNAPWVNHYFGYDCYFPNIVVENLRLSSPATITVVHNAHQYNYSHKAELLNGDKNENIYIPPEYLEITDNYGYIYKFPEENADFFNNTKYIYNGEEQ